MSRLGRWTLRLSWLLAGCTVGPDYEPPAPELPAAWVSSSTERDEEPDPRWWATLQDPQLVRYVEEAVERSPTVSLARARVREARALRRVDGADLWPDVGVAASYARYRVSENAPGPLSRLAEAGLSDLEQNDYLLGFDAGWEIDLFGGTRRATEAADARIEAAVEGERATLLSLESEVARNYVELRGAQRQREAMRRIIESQSGTLDLVRQRQARGLETRLAVEQASAELESSRAVLPRLEAEIRGAAFRLAVLVGDPPGSLLEELLGDRPLPAPPEVVPVGLPSTLLRRRPDVREVERRLHAATAEIGVATSDLYPRLFLTGAAGLQSAGFTDLFDASSRTWSLGPRIQWPVFQGGRIRAAVDLREARRDVVLAEFRQTVLEALAEVETSLVSYAQAQLTRRRLSASAEAQREAVTLADSLYEGGLADFLAVLDAQRRLAGIERSLAQAEEDVLVRLIALYKALGGGWEPFRPEPSAAGSEEAGGSSPSE